MPPSAPRRGIAPAAARLTAGRRCRCSGAGGGSVGVTRPLLPGRGAVARELRPAA